MHRHARHCEVTGCRMTWLRLAFYCTTVSAHSTATHSCIGMLQWPAHVSLKWPFARGDLNLSLSHCSLDTRFRPKQHLHWFSHFWTAHLCAQHTDHTTCDICSNRLHLCTADRRCSLNRRLRCLGTLKHATNSSFTQSTRRTRLLTQRTCKGSCVRWVSRRI